MYNFKIDKKIEELDPLDTLPSEKRADFIDSGLLPVAGNPDVEQPSKFQTKRVSIAELFDNFSTHGTALTLESSSTRSSDGKFSLSKAQWTGEDIDVSGTDVRLPIGWYQYTVRMNFTFSGTPLNKDAVIAIRSHLQSSVYQQATVNFDFSYAHTEQLSVTGLLHNTTSPVTFNVSVTGISDSGANSVSASLTIYIQKVSG